MSDLTVRDVAAELSVNPETVKRMLQSGRLSGYKVGSHWRVTSTALKQYKLGTANTGGWPNKLEPAEGEDTE